MNEFWGITGYVMWWQYLIAWAIVVFFVWFLIHLYHYITKESPRRHWVDLDKMIAETQHFASLQDNSVAQEYWNLFTHYLINYYENTTIDNEKD